VPARWSAWQFGLGDVIPVEHAAWTPLVLLIVALGVAPGIVLGATNPAVTGWFTNLFT
jgi:NADH:ubiquinone oxidoreductase subunit 4 (subunit M)